MADTNKCECGCEEQRKEKTCYEIVKDDGVYCSECGGFWELAHRGMFAHCPWCGAKIVTRTEAEDQEALMPCPFCGGEATIGTYDAKPLCVDWGGDSEDADGDASCPCCPDPPKVTEEEEAKTYYVVHCLNPECPAKPCVNDGFLYRSSAVEAWNTRLCGEVRPVPPEPKPLYPERPKPGCGVPPKPLYPPACPPRNGRPAPVFSVQRELRYDGIPVVHVPIYMEKPSTDDSDSSGSSDDGGGSCSCGCGTDADSSDAAVDGGGGGD